MAFNISPGVSIQEKDATNIIPAVSTTAGGFAGTFQWGPANIIRTVDSEKSLVSFFGKPNRDTAVSFFTAANFLGYGNNLNVVRVLGTLARNAVASGTAITIPNRNVYDAQYSLGGAVVGAFAAKYAGAFGNSIRVEICNSTGFSTWAYKGMFPTAPSTSSFALSRGGLNDEVHIVVIDALGAFTGTMGTVMERFAYVSVASDARSDDGSSIYYKKILNDKSEYVYWMNQPDNTLNWGTPSQGTTYSSTVAVIGSTLTGGVSDDVLTDANAQSGFSLFANPESVDVSLIPLGGASPVTAIYVINNIAEIRKDCMAFLSPNLSDVLNAVGVEADNIITTRNGLPSSSYAAMDSGWKYQYDRYNDTYRWIPLNGDSAGLCARTDLTNDPWWSPAGLNRGQIKNVVKLAYNPSKTDRDKICPLGINPVVSFPGEGTILFNDKTLLSKPSAFDQIGTRRLFIVLEKAIAKASKYILFEFNDPFTRSQFVSFVSPFLRDIKGRRGLSDFFVLCDETNNTGQVIDGYRFAASIFVKPARSIRNIELQFVATPTGLSFNEVVGI